MLLKNLLEKEQVYCYYLRLRTFRFTSYLTEEERLANLPQQTETKGNQNIELSSKTDPGLKISTKF